MGLFLTNIVLCGPTQMEVADVFRAKKRSAFISPTVDGRTVVFDERSEESCDALIELTKSLSKRFRCAALGVLVHDSDVLLLSLYQSGRGIDDYDSAPSYFESDGDPDELPEGGDAAALCRAMGNGDPSEVEAILRAGSNTEYVFAEERLEAIGRALSLPGFVARLCYSSLRDAAVESDPGADAEYSQMVRTP